MKLLVEIASQDVEFEQVTNVSFAPQVDITSSTVPVNRFSVDVKTELTLPLGATALLRDEDGIAWARYRIVKVENLGRGMKRVTCESMIGVLDGMIAEAYFFDGFTSYYEELVNILGEALSLDFNIDDGLQNIYVKGFAPRQTYRERLQWLLIACGAYICDAGSDAAEVMVAISAQPKGLIPINKTFWRPSLEQRGIVTAVEVTSYYITPGTPMSGEQSVVDGDGVEYIVQEQVISYNNPSATAVDAENVVRVDGVMLINNSNAPTVLTTLALRYMPREEMVFDCVDNREYFPGDKLSAHFSEMVAYSGFCESASFTFGLQARAQMRLVGVASVDIAMLVILRKCGDRQINRQVLYMPTGVTYSIDNPYIEQVNANHRYVYRPTQDKVTGVMPATDTTVEVQYTEALDLNVTTNVMRVLSVDEIEATTQEQTIDGETVTRKVAVIS